LIYGQPRFESRVFRDNRNAIGWHGVEIPAPLELERAPFDIVLMDVRIPVMDGKEAIQSICVSNEP
jgi:CheY-like chemotaxis protein